MKWFMFIAAVIFSAFLVSSVIVLDVQTGSQRAEITSLQQQLRQDQAQLAAVSAKASGGHRDLITCADLQAMGLETLLDVGLNTDASGNLSAVPEQQPVTLPSHCINQ